MGLPSGSRACGLVAQGALTNESARLHTLVQSATASPFADGCCAYERLLDRANITLGRIQSLACLVRRTIPVQRRLLVPIDLRFICFCRLGQRDFLAGTQGVALSLQHVLPHSAARLCAGHNMSNVTARLEVAVCQQLLLVNCLSLSLPLSRATAQGCKRISQAICQKQWS